MTPQAVLALPPGTTWREEDGCTYRWDGSELPDPMYGGLLLGTSPTGARWWVTELRRLAGPPAPEPEPQAPIPWTYRDALRTARWLERMR